MVLTWLWRHCSQLLPVPVCTDFDTNNAQKLALIRPMGILVPANETKLYSSMCYEPIRHSEAFKRHKEQKNLLLSSADSPKLSTATTSTFFLLKETKRANSVPKYFWPKWFGATGCNSEVRIYFNNERHELMRYDRALQKYQKASLKTTTSLALLNFGQNAIFSGALALAMYLVAKGVMQGTMTVGDMVMVNGLLFQLSIPLNFLGSVYREVRQAFIDMQTMFTLMKREPAIKNSASTVPLVIEESNSTIEFKNVYFQYTPGKPIFKDLSFTIPAGKKIAIVGGSGSGKSTITRLLYRFYEPDSGEILIGGTNIKDLDLNNLRKSIAIVPQDSVLFHDTLLYNLKYGNLEKSDEEAIEVAKLANLDWAVQSWPLKYETQVGERGLKLSGGEKQRVAIARAMLKGSPILIFDEATSSLDSITENQILDALDVATLNKTSVCIAHRLSTIMDADEILVLENGSLKERGSHCELLSDPSSMYYKMWNMQHHARKPEMNQ
ncbi:unnamed protein product [Nesidiocoris tenuis]|uniref:Iron-sulfur clusters transporter ABCB7, mitochondrial n=1 Tax=Nesidiocoris tenuis TaxID=355587 RepID=A0A6H5GFS7_9HEMI|nr:unnamed protein product [Nesidiocoris tenuis]